MRSRIDKELERDIKFLNEVLAQTVRASVISRENVILAEKSLDSLPSSEIEKLSPEARKALKLVKKHLPTFREVFDWRTMIGVNIGERLDEIVTGDFDASTCNDLMQMRDDLRKSQENILAGLLLLTQPRVLTPEEFLDIVLQIIPDDTDNAKTYFRDLKKFLVEVGAKTDTGSYWQGVVSWANALSFMALLMGILEKWIQYGLEEWQEAQKRGRRPANQPLRRIGRLRSWLARNQPFMSLADLILRTLGR